MQDVGVVDPVPVGRLPDLHHVKSALTSTLLVKADSRRGIGKSCEPSYVAADLGAAVDDLPFAQLGSFSTVRFAIQFLVMTTRPTSNRLWMPDSCPDGDRSAGSHPTPS